MKAMERRLISVAVLFLVANAGRGEPRLDDLVFRARQAVERVRNGYSRVAYEETFPEDDRSPNPPLFRKRTWEVQLAFDRSHQLFRLDYRMEGQIDVAGEAGRPTAQVMGIPNGMIWSGDELSLTRDPWFVRAEDDHRGLYFSTDPAARYHDTYDRIRDPMSVTQDFVDWVNANPIPSRPGQVRGVSIEELDNGRRALVRFTIRSPDHLDESKRQYVADLTDDFLVDTGSGAVERHRVFHRMIPSKDAVVTSDTITVLPGAPKPHLLGTVTVQYQSFQGVAYPCAVLVVDNGPVSDGKRVAWVQNRTERFTFLKSLVNNPRIVPAKVVLYPCQGTAIHDASGSALTPAEYWQRLGFLPRNSEQVLTGRNHALNLDQFLPGGGK